MRAYFPKSKKDRVTGTESQSSSSFCMQISLNSASLSPPSGQDWVLKILICYFVLLLMATWHCIFLNYPKHGFHIFQRLFYLFISHHIPPLISKESLMFPTWTCSPLFRFQVPGKKRQLGDNSSTFSCIIPIIWESQVN